MTAPRIQYCTTSDGVSVAFYTVGEGPVLLVVHGMPSSAAPITIERFGYLADAGFKIVGFDRRGFGHSQRGIDDFTLDKLVLDVEAVVDRAGFERVPVFAPMLGASVGATYAALHPERVSHLILFNPYVRGTVFWESPRSRAFKVLRETDWDTYVETVARFFSADPVSGAEIVRASVNPDDQRRFMEATESHDATPYLSRVTCPTLVIHLALPEPQDPGADEIRRVAAALPNCSLVIAQDGATVAGSAWSFIHGAAQPPAKVAEPAGSALRTVLFTDLVGHTEMMSRLGDERGRDVLREHERITREVLKANGGTEVKTMGDGFMASFGSVTKAVECAIALQRAFAEREGEPLNVRVGLNAGEPIEEDGDLFGATVILASRIAAKAGAGEILVADTVRGLCSGKGFLFADRGEFVAKGFEEPVRVSEVNWR
jgi:class 3 adenylate cyclase/pimeloyl-ACP methyl ester carboxylesterase